MKAIFATFLCLTVISTLAENRKPKVTVNKVRTTYNGKKVKARELTVSSEIPIPIDQAWHNVKTPALLRYVAKGMIRFKSTDNEFPNYWEVGKKYGAKMRVFGFMPFGGTHYLLIERIDNSSFEISTKEWNKRAKIWNHDLIMRDLGNGKIFYEDSIVIYGGFMTSFITAFAKKFYKHRQRRWQTVAKKNLTFGK